MNANPETAKPSLFDRLVNPDFRIAELIGQAEVDRIARAIAADDVTITITKYHDGWVPNSYRFDKKGSRTTVSVSVAGEVVFESRHDKYDMKRSKGVGPSIVVTIAKASQKRGRNI